MKIFFSLEWSLQFFSLISHFSAWEGRHFSSNEMFEFYMFCFILTVVFFFYRTGLMFSIPKYFVARIPWLRMPSSNSLVFGWMTLVMVITVEMGEELAWLLYLLFLQNPYFSPLLRFFSCISPRKPPLFYLPGSASEMVLT